MLRIYSQWMPWQYLTRATYRGVLLGGNAWIPNSVMKKEEGAIDDGQVNQGCTDTMESGNQVGIETHFAPVGNRFSRFVFSESLRCTANLKLVLDTC
jgi:hypothetical protein